MLFLQSIKQSIKTKSFFKKYALVYLVILLLIISFWAGLMVGQKNYFASYSGTGQVFNKDDQPKSLSKDVNFEIFWEVWDLINKKYIDRPVAESKLFYGALSGLVAALNDPHSIFLDPKVTDEFNQELTGNYEGIGAEIGIRKERLTIIAPLPNSPAEKAGLRAGDKIFAIDDQDTTNMSLDYAIHLIKGKKGTKVIFMVNREGEKELLKVEVTRDAITVDSIKFEFKNNIAWVQINNFNESTQAEFERVVKKILDKNPQGIILDLRDNPGGYFDLAVTVAGEWLKNEVVVRERFNDGKENEYRSDGKARLQDFKTVVLVNLGSASASEIVAGALQDYGKATIVGEITFGKGSVQDLISLEDGSSLKITVARWFTPQGRSIDNEGIKPDVEIELTKDDYDNNRDPQLDKALELLK